MKEIIRGLSCSQERIEMHMEFRWGNLWKVTTWKTKTT
jgi:hypothetical protein